MKTTRVYVAHIMRRLLFPWGFYGELHRQGIMHGGPLGPHVYAPIADAILLWSKGGFPMEMTPQQFIDTVLVPTHKLVEEVRAQRRAEHRAARNVRDAQRAKPGWTQKERRQKPPGAPRD